MGCVRRRRWGGGVRGAGKEKRNGGNERKGKEKIKRENKEKKGKGKEREKDEGGRRFFLSSLAFRRSELVRPRNKVRRFDEELRFKR